MEMESWKSCHVNEIADELLRAAAEFMTERIGAIQPCQLRVSYSTKCVNDILTSITEEIKQSPTCC